MATDPYSVLGVSRTATADEIRRAYRKLAKESHPDLHQGDKAAEDRFKAINSANDLLSDVEKRGRYDRGEIDAAGEPRYQAPPDFGGRGRRGGGPFGGMGGQEDGEYEDIFADLLHGGGGRGNARRRGRDRSYTLAVDFLDAINGANQRLDLPGGGSVEVRIPPGMESGQVLRLKEKGEPGRNGGMAGDALIEISVRPHKLFRREGNDIFVELPVSLAEAMLGAKLSVPTTSGTVALSIPAGSNNGGKLRLRGRGVAAHGGQPAGDQFVLLRVVLDPNDTALATYLKDRPDAPGFDPRGDFLD